MLVSIAVRDFVLIDGLVLELGEGLNVLSGETGAGKSILVDALSLVLGGRARPDVVRTGREHAEVEAVFDLSRAADVRARVSEQGLDADADEPTLIVRRTVSSSGRSKAYVNGRAVTAAQLATITRGLVDVSSQHESQALCDAGTHAELLDAYAHLGADRASLAFDVDAIATATREIEAIRARVELVRAREDYLRFQLQEIDELDARPGEELELEAQRARLRHADKLASLTRAAADRLDDGEETILDALRRVGSDVAHAAELDATLGAQVGAIEGAIAELAEAARTLSRYAADVESDPHRLAEIEERLFKLQKLLRKHASSADDLVAKRALIAGELASLDASEDAIATIDRDRQARVLRAVERAKTLSGKRRDAARTLGDSIASELASLAMGRARIHVDVAPIAAPVSSEEPATASIDDGVIVPWGDGGRARLTKTGIDRVELMIAPNPGEEPRPLRRIASGGELSRALLAVKRVLASTGPAGMYVFDEVDAGVGGAVAEAIGRKIADVARHHQVLCITHLAQIAAFADVHFTVAKREDQGRTRSEVKRVDKKARTEEIARMLGGATVTATTRKAAEEMIRASRREQV